MNTARNLVLALVSAVLLLTGCSSGGAETSPTEPVEASIQISGDQVQAPGERINATRGQTVRLTVVSDHADELHVHGYDKALELRPNEPATLEFQADVPGVFEIELHESKAKLPSLEVR